MSLQFQIPTEVVELPSKGILYSKESPLSKGEVEIKYPTAVEEDILTNLNYIEKGTVIDKFLESLIVTEGVNYEDLLNGDKNAIMIAARVLAYGKNYPVKIPEGEEISVDLTQINPKQIDIEDYKNGNEFSLILPKSGYSITFKLLSHKDEKKIEEELKGLRKLHKNGVIPEGRTRFKHIITSINGSTEPSDIRTFVEKAFLTQDIQALRKEYSRVNPDIDRTFEYTTEDGSTKEGTLAIGLNFFFPDAEV